ncbi:MAG: hypothetical protein ACD_49C00003G0001, partial [uncultured bacterium (gcode 4)]
MMNKSVDLETSQNIPLLVKFYIDNLARNKDELIAEAYLEKLESKQGINQLLIAVKKGEQEVRNLLFEKNIKKQESNENDEEKQEAVANLKQEHNDLYEKIRSLIEIISDPYRDKKEKNKFEKFAKIIDDVDNKEKYGKNIKFADILLTDTKICNEFVDLFRIELDEIKKSKSGQYLFDKSGTLSQSTKIQVTLDFRTLLLPNYLIGELKQAGQKVTDKIRKDIKNLVDYFVSLEEDKGKYTKFFSRIKKIKKVDDIEKLKKEIEQVKEYKTINDDKLKNQNLDIMLRLYDMDFTFLNENKDDNENDNNKKKIFNEEKKKLKEKYNTDVIEFVNDIEKTLI